MRKAHSDREWSSREPFPLCSGCDAAITDRIPSPRRPFPFGMMIGFDIDTVCLVLSSLSGEKTPGDEAAVSLSARDEVIMKSRVLSPALIA